MGESLGALWAGKTDKENGKEKGVVSQLHSTTERKTGCFHSASHVGTSTASKRNSTLTWWEQAKSPTQDEKTESEEEVRKTDESVSMVVTIGAWVESVVDKGPHLSSSPPVFRASCCCWYVT